MTHPHLQAGGATPNAAEDAGQLADLRVVGSGGGCGVCIESYDAVWVYQDVCGLCGGAGQLAALRLVGLRMWARHGHGCGFGVGGAIAVPCALKQGRIRTSRARGLGPYGCIGAMAGTGYLSSGG